MKALFRCWTQLLPKKNPNSLDYLLFYLTNDTYLYLDQVFHNAMMLYIWTLDPIVSFKFHQYLLISVAYEQMSRFLVMISKVLNDCDIVVFAALLLPSSTLRRALQPPVDHLHFHNGYFPSILPRLLCLNIIGYWAVISMITVSFFLSLFL
jgi:hypothetical protein